MSSLALLLQGLRHYGRIHLAVALGVAAGTAVLTGALLVGDSVRGSLRDLTLERLGAVDEVVLSGGFFRQELAGELAASEEFRRHFGDALPVILLRASLLNPQLTATEGPAGASKARGFSGRVNVLGCDERFWKGAAHAPKKIPGSDEVVLNEALGKELGVEVAQDVSLRLPAAQSVPSETTFGEKTENKANAILVTGKEGRTEPSPAAAGVVARLLRPTLADYGVEIVKTERGYLQVISQALVFSPALEEAVLAALKEDGAQGALAYLANYIAAGKNGEAKIPYSIVAAVDFSSQPPLGPWRDIDGKELSPLAGEREIVLNQWAFDDLNRQLAAAEQKLAIGDEISLTYFLPEHPGGRAVETTTTFRLAAVVPLDEGSPARDADFTPTVKGVTDQRSIRNWKAPFPYHQERVRDEDDDYWTQYRATPKAFVSLRTGQELFGSKRFGRLTSIRLPGEGRTADEIAGKLGPRLEPEKLGFRILAVKRDGLAAAAGTTPFGGLFVAFSSFIIIAAVTLVGLLFRLAVESRAGEVGLLLATGFSRRKVRRLLAAEGFVVAVIGGAIGVAAGAGYAWLMLYGLRTWWVDAVATPFLHFHSTWLSFVVGGLCGILISQAAVWSTLWFMRKLPVRRLLAGQATPDSPLTAGRPRISRIVAAASFVAAIGLAVVALWQHGQAQAGAFFGSGVLVLVAGLAAVWGQLRVGATGRVATPGALPLVRLAVRNAARHSGRSTLTIGLIASAVFLIVALSAFRIEPVGDAREIELAERLAQLRERRASDAEIGIVSARLNEQRELLKSGGTGGFSLVAETGLPVFRDLNDRTVLAEAGLQTADIERLKGGTIYSFRTLPGEDASCRNLYQTRRPRILGVPKDLIDRGGFAFASSAAADEAQRKNPWLLLNASAGETKGGKPYVPVVMDMNTAMYSLHLYTVGSTLDIEDDEGNKVPLRLVGMLANSTLQGDVLMSEENFLRQFPQVIGYRFSLVETPPERTAAELRTIQHSLEAGLVNFGFDAERSADRLREFLSVQNTYLTTFQSLGALGLLLGTFGLATVQLRNVLERRSELALLRAAGFRRRRLAGLVMLEGTCLLVGGVGVGVAAALVAVVPHLVLGTAAIPWLDLAWQLTVIVVFGFVASLWAVRATLHAPLIAALRGD
ncbi:MAG: ABC transporter permease [Planctomycetia bacterium]|nr:ABC transporter permease [Planctomycetia bacterium]